MSLLLSPLPPYAIPTVTLLLRRSPEPMLRAMRLAGNIPLISANVPRLSGASSAEENFELLADRVGDMTCTDKSKSSGSVRDSSTSTADVSAVAARQTTTSSSLLLEYEFGFYKAMATFKHQLIFDTRTRTVSRNTLNNFVRNALCGCLS